MKIDISLLLVGVYSFKPCEIELYHLTTGYCHALSLNQNYGFRPSDSAINSTDHQSNMKGREGPSYCLVYNSCAYLVEFETQACLFVITAVVKAET